MYAKDFNEGEHMTCPVCNFEVVWALGKKAGYVYKDGELDQETVTRDNDYCEDEMIMCNSIHCDWEVS